MSVVEGQDFKVAVLCCNGVGRLSSTVSRQAAYRIAQQRPNEVVLISSSALIADEPTALALVNRYPMLVIDGCRPHCATAIADGKGKRIATSIYIPDIMAKQQLSIAGEKRRELTARGFQLVDAIVAHAVEQIDCLLAEEILSTL